MSPSSRSETGRKIRTLIVDDEPLACSGLATMLADDDEIEVIGTCGDGEAAVSAIREQRPDLVYLDVQMPRLNGFEAIERLAPGRCPAVIFVTAFDQHAIQAFQAGAVGYLLKPFRDVHFWESLDRAKQQIGRAEAPPAGSRAPADRPPAPPSRVAFKVGGDYVFAGMDEIVWIEAQREHVQVCVGSQILRVRESLQSVEERLDPARHVRIHRSFIVNPAHIKRIAPTDFGDYTVLMSDGTRLRLSRSYRHQLQTLLPAHFSARSGTAAE
jgi:two-component system LytT family response regulator